MFKATRKQIQTIYNIACDNWKTRLLNLIKFDDNITLTYDQVKEMFDAASEDQKKTLKKVFPEYETKKTIFERIQTFDDILKEIGKTYDEVIPWKNPKTKAQKAQNAFAKLQCITEAYNEDKKPIWGNSNQPNYYNWFERTSRGGWAFDFVYGHCAGADVGSGCYFVERKAAEDAAKKFIDIYIDYLPE